MSVLGMENEDFAPDRVPHVDRKVEASYSQAQLDAAMQKMVERAATHWPTIGYCFSLYRLECCGDYIVPA